MATERTVLTPEGEIIYFEVADEQYMTQTGDILDGGLDAGGTILPQIMHHRQQQE